MRDLPDRLPVSDRVDQIADPLVEPKAGRVMTVGGYDSVRVALLLGNFMAAALYGPSGELRERQGELPEAGD